MNEKMQHLGGGGRAAVGFEIVFKPIHALNMQGYAICFNMLNNKLVNII